MAAVEDKPEFRAQARWVRTAPRKAQLVVEEIRGRTVPEARVILAFMRRAAAKDVEGVLNSAVANAESHPLSVYSGDDLYVAAAEVGTGPTLKRWRARARGRVGRIKKRTCHITIRLEPVEAAAGPRGGRAAAAPEGRRAAPASPRGGRAAAAAAPEPEAAAVAEPPVEIEPEAAVPEAVEEAPAEEAPAEEQPRPEPAPKPRAQEKKADEPAPESTAGEES